MDPLNRFEPIKSADHQQGVARSNIDNLAVAKKVGDFRRLIFLSGASSSGKTSIMSAFCKNQSNNVRLGIDDFFKETSLPNLIKDSMPDDYRILSDAFNDIELFEVCNPYVSINDLLEKRLDCFKQDATAEQKKAAKDLLLDESFRARFKKELEMRKVKEYEPHFESIFDQFEKGNTVIFDTIYPKEFFEFIQKKGILVEGKVSHLLVYLPLPVLLERAVERNEIANNSGYLGNLRSLPQVMMDFTHHYKTAEGNDKVVATLKKSDIEEIFKKYEKELADKRKEDGTIEFAGTKKEEFLSHFQFGEMVKEVDITTTFRIPMGILDSTSTILENANHIRNHTWKKIQ